MDREDILLRIRNTKDLPTLPGVAARIFQVTHDEEASARELANIVINDQSVSAKVLNLANSAFYGFARMITTIPQAVVVLGFDTVRSLALSVSVFDALGTSPGRASLDREAFWMHAIGCGAASRLIATELGYRDTGTSFMLGLLHDLGKVIMDTYLNEEYQEVVQEVVEEGRPSFEVESEILDIDHAEIGGWLAFRWRFPEVLVAPIEHHHNPLAAEEQHVKETLVVHLANVLTKRVGIGACYEDPILDPVDMVESELGLSDEKIDALSDSLSGEKAQIEEFLNYMKG